MADFKHDMEYPPMRGYRFSHLFAAGTFALLMALPGHALADTIGKITFASGAVEVERDGARQPIANGADVMKSDRFHTGNEARLRIELSDGAEIVLGSGSSFAVIDYLDEPEEDGGGFALFRHIRGVFSFTGGETEDRGGEVAVETNVGTIGIRGTQFWGGPLDSEDTEIFLVEGEVSVTNAGGIVILQPGDGTKLTSWGEAPTPAKQWPDAKVTRALETVALPADAE